MDESQDLKPHPVVHSLNNPAQGVEHEAQPSQSLSIWFFCGILMLAYGIVLTGTGVYEHFGHQPNTVLANLEPTLWWGIFLTLFGLFYTVRFRPGKH
jgi:hypothetical protein